MCSVIRNFFHFSFSWKGPLNECQGASLSLKKKAQISFDESVLEAGTSYFISPPSDLHLVIRCNYPNASSPTQESRRIFL